MDSESWAAELSPAADASRNVPAAERATGNVLAAGRVCATVTLPLESRSERTKQLLTTATPTPDTVSSTVTPTREDLGGVSCTAIILSSKISNSCRYFFEIRCVPIWVLGRAFFRFDSVILLLFRNVVDYYIIYCQIINTAFIMVFIFDLEKECVLMYILK